MRSKLEEDLGGKPVLQRTVEVFTKLESESANLNAIVVAGPHDPEAFQEFRTRHADRLGLLGAKLVPGGAVHRWESVAAALAHVPPEAEFIAVHDAARPCVSHELIERVMRAALRFGAAIPGVDVPDTLKRVAEQDIDAEAPDAAAVILGLERPATTRQRFVSQTVDRRGVVLVQTPQIFRSDVLRAAYAQIGSMSQPEREAITDDAGLVEAWLARRGSVGVDAGPEAPRAVAVVPGEPTNLKITKPADLPLARAILGVRGPEDKPAHKRF